MSKRLWNRDGQRRTVRAVRARLGMTQRRLAKEIGVHEATVQRWESGAGPISPTALRLLWQIERNAHGDCGLHCPCWARGVREGYGEAHQ